VSETIQQVEADPDRLVFYPDLVREGGPAARPDYPAQLPDRPDRIAHGAEHEPGRRGVEDLLSERQIAGIGERRAGPTPGAGARVRARASMRLPRSTAVTRCIAGAGFSPPHAIASSEEARLS